MTNEIWKDVEGYEGRYMISNFARVYSHKHKKIMKQSLTPNGYKWVGLYDDEGKLTSCYVHRLVAKAFIDNAEGHPLVNHIDEDKTNNHIDNLEWCSWSYNIRYGTALQSKCKPVRLNGIEYKSIQELCDSVGISRTTANEHIKKNLIEFIEKGDIA